MAARSAVQPPLDPPLHRPVENPHLISHPAPIFPVLGPPFPIPSIPFEEEMTVSLQRRSEPTVGILIS